MPRTCQLQRAGRATSTQLPQFLLARPSGKAFCWDAEGKKRRIRRRGAVPSAAARRLSAEGAPRSAPQPAPSSLRKEPKYFQTRQNSSKNIFKPAKIENQTEVINTFEKTWQNMIKPTKANPNTPKTGLNRIKTNQNKSKPSKNPPKYFKTRQN